MKCFSHKMLISLFTKSGCRAAAETFIYAMKNIYKSPQFFCLVFWELQVHTSTCLVLRRRVSAKWSTLVYSTVRPSRQEIVELSKNFNFFIRSSMLISGLTVIVDGWGALGGCTDQNATITGWICVFHLYMESAYIGDVPFEVIIFFNVKNWRT